LPHSFCLPDAQTLVNPLHGYRPKLCRATPRPAMPCSGEFGHYAAFWVVAGTLHGRDQQSG